MVISESRFKADTKSSDRISFLFENFADTFEFKNNEILIKENVVFISYRHGEEEYVYRLKDLLKQYGFDGYMDIEDDAMPKETSGETAKKLKERIFKAKKFILVATNAAINSKWCNWEIGYADPYKYINHLALLSLKPDNSNYDGEEYLQIYPSIQVNRNGITSNYFVQYPNGENKPLSEWLKI